MQQYTQCVVSAVPSCFQTPVDNETSFRDTSSPGKKRCQKAVERTTFYAKEIDRLRQNDEKLRRVPYFLSLTGGNNAEQRLRGLLKANFEVASGVALDGFFVDRIDDSGKSCDHTLQVDAMFEALETVCLQLPVNLPRFLADVWQPDEVVRAVTVGGIDVFDGTLPFRLSRSGIAWHYIGWSGTQGTGSNSTSSVILPPWVLFPFEKVMLEKEDKLFEQPIQEGCKCFTCQRHNRAYISHLHSVNEMLAHILLMIHNSTQCYRFFADLRRAIEVNRLDDFSEFCKNHHFPEHLVRVDLTSVSLQCEDA